jgi:hypothetical protein
MLVYDSCSTSISVTFQLLQTPAPVLCLSVPTHNAPAATRTLLLTFSTIMSSLPHGLLYTSAEFVGVYARVNRSSFLQVLSPQLLLSLALTMAPQHKQKVHKTNFSAVPTQQSRAPLSSPALAHACRICDRAYVSASALVQHYRDTPVHPKCTRCNIGFVDNTAIQAVSSHLMLIPTFG